MLNHQEILDSEIDEPNSVSKAILKKWMRIAFTPIFLVLVYFIGKYTGMLNIRIGFVFGFTLGTLIKVLITEKNQIYIYSYSIEKQFLLIYLVNIFYKKETKIFALSDIEKSKYRARNFWRNSDKLFFQISGSIYEFYSMRKEIGENLINDLNLVKKKKST